MAALPPRTGRPTSTSASGPASPRPRGPEGAANRLIEAQVTALDGHKSLYSDAYYDQTSSGRLYGGDDVRRAQAALRPRVPTARPLLQGGATQVTIVQDQRADSTQVQRRLIDGPDPRAVHRRPCRLRFTAFDGSATGPADAELRTGPQVAAGRELPRDRARRPRHGPGLRRGRPRPRGRPPRRPLRAARRDGRPALPDAAAQDCCRPSPARSASSCCGRRPRPRRRPCRGGAAWRRGCGTAGPATPRRSTTTTTCPTRSTSTSSARR